MILDNCSNLEYMCLSALNAMKNTYSPYSKFPVGAALETASGEIFIGTNVENCSYGLTMCAERVAAFTAVAAGHTKFKRIITTTLLENGGSPCGACRQVLYEFGGPNMEIICLGINNAQIISSKKFKLSDLLPDAFGPAQLINF